MGKVPYYDLPANDPTTGEITLFNTLVTSGWIMFFFFLSFSHDLNLQTFSENVEIFGSSTF